MRITDVELTTVVVPIHDGSWHSEEFNPEGYTYGGQWIRLHWQEFPIVILQLHTDEGLIGLGEVSKGIPETRVREAAAFFEGRDLWSINLQELPLETMWFADPSVYAAFEMALFDLMGKALGIPAYRLFGGQYRDWVPVSRCSGRMNPQDAAAAATAAVEQGYSVLKMKATFDDPIVERLAAIQDAVGDQLGVVVDPNQRFASPYRLFEVLDELKAAGVSNVQCFEDPFDRNNLDWYVLARQKMTVPLALHLDNASSIKEAVKHEACDWINTSGPMVAVYKQTAIAEAAGIPTWHGSGIDLGIAEASYAHVCAASKSMTLTSDICGEALRVNDLISEPLEIRDGMVRVPEGPGLGVELDFEALERFRVDSNQGFAKGEDA